MDDYSTHPSGMEKRLDVPLSARGILVNQDGVITRQQAAACGLTDQVVQRLVRQGWWQRLDQGIYVGRTVPPGWDQWVRGGLLWSGTRAAVGGLAAAYRHGLIDEAPRQIDLWVATSTSHRPARCRWRLRYDGLGRLERARRDPLVTSVEDTILDVADLSDIDRALSVLTRALSQGRTIERRVARALALRPRVRHRKVLADVVSARKGYESPLEYHADTDVLLPHGLPRGHAQALTAAGRVDRLIEEYRLVLELDGRAGHEGDGRFRDMERDNANTLSRYRTLRLGWSDVRLRPCVTARVIATVLRQEGWTGTFKQCPKCRGAGSGLARARP